MKDDILVLPDAHDEPGVSKERFRWAGNLIVDRQPGSIVNLGDGATMDSLSQYDKGTLISEGRRYADDIDSFVESQEELWLPLDRYNKRQVKNKKKQYDPRKVYTLGNHEGRIFKAVNKDPKLEGTIKIEHLQLDKYYDEVYPLTVPANVNGIAFAHYFTSGILGKPVSGITHARQLVAKTLVTAVVGHSHDRSFWETTDVFGRKLFGLVAGCYFDHDLCYTTEEDRNWPGLVYLRKSATGYDPEFIAMEEVKRRYA